MNLHIKIIGVERTENGMNRLVIKINNSEITSLLLTDSEIQTPQLALDAIKRMLKAKAHVGYEFDIVI